MVFEYSIQRILHGASHSSLSAEAQPLVYEHNDQNIVITIIQTTTELSCISIIHIYSYVSDVFFIPHDITRSILIGPDVQAEAG